jgi:NADPH2:quinone reductase
MAKMNKAVRIHRNGGPEEMKWEDAPISPAAMGEVRVRHSAIGVNFSDINVRRGGFYPNQAPLFPLTLGNEAAGVVESVGIGVTEFKVGQRVAYAGIFGQFYEDTGAYCELRNVPAERLVAIPDGVSDQQAAAMLLKGSTASLIINRLYKPQPGDTILIHTAASGVGSILCQWSKHLGATVIGTAGSLEKAATGKQNGCDHVILYRHTDFVAEVRKLEPNGVSAVFDGVGKDTFIPSLQCLRRFGRAVNYGNASGSVPPLDIQTLAIKSLSVSRAGVTGHIQDAASLRQVATELFDLVARGTINVPIQKTYSLQDAANAHADVESAKYSGSLLLIPPT